MNFSAVILAGGRSSRMGRDKAWMELAGQPLLAHQIERARQAGAAEVFISGRAGVDYRALGCPVLLDQQPDTGPLAGIVQALEASASPLLLALAVDMPAFDAACLQRLLACSDGTRGAIPVVEGRLEPLAAFYPKTALPLAGEILARGGGSVARLARRCVELGLAARCEFGADDAACFKSWNRPCDVEAEPAALTQAV